MSVPLRELIDRHAGGVRGQSQGVWSGGVRGQSHGVWSGGVRGQLKLFLFKAALKCL